MNVYKHVTPLIVILLLTVVFVGVVTIHPTMGTTALSAPEGAALRYKGVAYLCLRTKRVRFCRFPLVAQRLEEHGSQLRLRARYAVSLQAVHQTPFFLTLTRPPLTPR